MSTLQKRRYPRTSLRPKFSSLNIWFIYNKTTPLCLNQKVFPSQMYLRKCSIHHQIHSVAINNVSPPLSLITQSVCKILNLSKTTFLPSLHLHLFSTLYLPSILFSCVPFMRSSLFSKNCLLSPFLPCLVSPLSPFISSLSVCVSFYT